MTYTSGSPAPMTPEAKLANRQWRYINSWWIFPPILSLGFLGWLGFMVAAARTGKKNYWIFTGVYAGLFALAVTLISIDSEGLAGNLAVIPILACWLGATIHAAILNHDYLRALAAKGVWYQNPNPQSAPQHLHTPGQPFLGVTGNDYYGPAQGGTQHGHRPPPPPSPQHTGHQPYAYAPQQPAQAPAPAPARQTRREHAPAGTGPLHIGTATIDQLAAVPGVDHALANRIVAIRDARGDYRDLDDLAAAANLAPHELVRLRGHITFEQPSQDKPQEQQRHGGSGRILDI